jgi:hypothetical protein
MFHFFKISSWSYCKVIFKIFSVIVFNLCVSIVQSYLLWRSMYFWSILEARWYLQLMQTVFHTCCRADPWFGKIRFTVPNINFRIKFLCILSWCLWIKLKSDSVTHNFFFKNVYSRQHFSVLLGPSSGLTGIMSRAKIVFTIITYW